MAECNRPYFRCFLIPIALCAVLVIKPNVGKRSMKHWLVAIVVATACLCGCGRQDRDILSEGITPDAELAHEFAKAFSVQGYTNRMQFSAAYKITRRTATSYFAAIFDDPSNTLNLSGRWVTIAKVREQWMIVSNGTWRATAPARDDWRMKSK